MKHPKVYAASCFDRCSEEWVIKKVFLCKDEAIKYAYDKTQYASRCNRPLEWWRVEEHTLTPCSDGGVIWGCHCVSTGVIQ